jgi:hypothetical protein
LRNIAQVGDANMSCGQQVGNNLRFRLVFDDNGTLGSVAHSLTQQAKTNA